MAKADIAALLALGAALFIAIGDVMHQRSAHEVTDEPVSHLELFTRLLRDGRWWLGSLVAAVGFALQAAALGFGSVLLVQAILVTSLLFALPINARLAASAGDPVGMAVGGAARRCGGGDRDRRQSDGRTLARVMEDVDCGGGRPRPRIGALRAGRGLCQRPRECSPLGVRVRRAVGCLRSADQGRRGPARRRAVGSCCAHPSSTCGRWSPSRARRTSRRPSAPDR